jgi:AcrR family transcriptional regulator
MHADQTTQAILNAALHVFAERSYSEAGVRDIAAHAGVNPALIARYYGSKLKLFEAALEASLDATVFTRVDKPVFGETMAGIFCAPENRKATRPLPMIVFAAGDREARASALKMLRKHIMAPLELWFGEDDAKERVAQFLAVATGFFTYRLMLPLGPMKGEISPSMRSWLAGALQEIVDR